MVFRNRQAASDQQPPGWVCSGISLLLVACLVTLSTGLGETVEPRLYQQGVVAADHPLASAAGIEILQRGGNVIDAAVATAFTLSVVRPESSGLGGGGFLLHWDVKSASATAWDYRERAPLAATADMYRKSAPERPAASSVHGPLAIAVPGQIPGLCLIHQQHGRLPLRDVLAPAIRLATEGVLLDDFARSTQRSLLAEFEKHPKNRVDFALLWKGYLNEGSPWKQTDRFYSPQRPALEWLAAQGLAAWTNGPIGQALVAYSRQQGALLTASDLEQMQPVPRRPLQGEFAGHQWLTMPPPSSGGIALLETWQILSAWERATPGTVWKDLPEPERVHILSEALKHAFADRAEFLGDTDFVSVPVERLLSREHAERLAAKIHRDKTLSTGDYGRFQGVNDAGTTHFCVMDEEGNAVACTETINTTFGSYLVEPTTGIVLNNEMDDFTTVPGQVNAFGLQQSAANQIEPRKKPLSSMTPTIVLKDGRAVAIAGASGGPKIITATLQALLQMIVFDQGAQAAVSAPRLHHQWMPDELLLEQELSKLQPALAERGHTVKFVRGLAATQAIRRTPAGLEGGSDPRKSGQPAGY